MSKPNQHQNGIPGKGPSNGPQNRTRRKSSTSVHQTDVKKASSGSSSSQSVDKDRRRRKSVQESEDGQYASSRPARPQERRRSSVGSSSVAVARNRTEESRRAKKDTAYIGMFKAKILIIGPCESGKSVLANFLSDATETSGGDYHPTQGVRILEFECNGIEVSAGRTANIEVELWDCSGDQKFSTCWPAFQKDSNGVVMVYNPDQVNHDKELESWYSKFITAQGLKDSQCVVFAHHKPTSTDRTRSQLPPALSRVTCIQTNLDEEAETVREEFNNFLAKVISNWTDKRDQEELSIMNH